MKCRAAFAGVAALFLLFGCSAEKPPLKPDNAINETISRQLSESSELMLDEVTAPWDTVLIDSAYSAPTSLETLKVSNRCQIQDIPYEDETIVLVFLRGHRAVSYTYIRFSEEQETAIFQQYLYQNTGRVYPPGTIFSTSEKTPGKPE